MHGKEFRIMGSRRVKITLDCVANRYASTDERIVEFDSPNGGGLISFFLRADGSLSVVVYRHDATVVVAEGDHGERSTT